LDQQASLRALFTNQRLVIFHFARASRGKVSLTVVGLRNCPKKVRSRALFCPPQGRSRVDFLRGFCGTRTIAFPFRKNFSPRAILNARRFARWRSDFRHFESLGKGYSDCAAKFHPICGSWNTRFSGNGFRDLRLVRTLSYFPTEFTNQPISTEDTMGFLKRFFRGVFHEGAPAAPAGSSFEQLSEEELEAHLGVQKYGRFTLTDAVRPSYDLKVVPKQGYRHDFYLDEEARTKVPVLMASASRERLFDIFLALIEPLGPEVDVVLETSHNRDSAGHTDLYREHIDMPVLKSTLWDYEDLLLGDGCTGIAVLNPSIPQEVQFDEHKLLIVYGNPLADYEQVFRDFGVVCDEKIKFITEAEHVHSSSDKHFDQFEEMRMRLGMDAGY
jgi:hypothetical protein